MSFPGQLTRLLTTVHPTSLRRLRPAIWWQLVGNLYFLERSSYLRMHVTHLRYLAPISPDREGRLNYQKLRRWRSKKDTKFWTYPISSYLSVLLWMGWLFSDFLMFAARSCWFGGDYYEAVQGQARGGLGLRCCGCFFLGLLHTIGVSKYGRLFFTSSLDRRNSGCQLLSDTFLSGHRVSITLLRPSTLLPVDVELVLSCTHVESSDEQRYLDSSDGSNAG